MRDHKMKKLALAISLLPSLAWGQPATSPPPNPQEQIERTIGNLFVTNTNLAAQLQVTQMNLNKAQERIKELEQAKGTENAK